jgi:hypothetical protein
VNRNFIPHHHPNNRIRKPTNSTQKAKSLGRLPLPAISAIRHAILIESATAAVSVEPIDGQAEGGEPSRREDKIHRPIEDKVVGEGEAPQHGEDDGDAGDHLGVNEAAGWPGGLVG